MRIDTIASYQPRLERFQVWEMMKIVNSDNAIITMREDKATILSQFIPYTDFPLDEIKLWVIDGVLLLPSEY